MDSKKDIEIGEKMTLMNLQAKVLIDKNKLQFSDSAISLVIILQTKLLFLDTPAPTPENTESHNPSQIRTSRNHCPETLSLQTIAYANSK